MSNSRYARPPITRSLPRIGGTDTALRLATPADQARIDALVAECLAAKRSPDTTTVSLSLAELTALAGGFVRYNEADEAIYNKLQRAKARLVERESK